MLNILDMNSDHVIVYTGARYFIQLSYKEFAQLLYPYTKLIYEFVKYRVIEAHRPIVERKLDEDNSQIDNQLNSWKDPR